MSKIKNVGRPKISEDKKHKMVGFAASPDLIQSIKEQSELLFGGNKTKYIVHKLTQKSSITVKNEAAILDRSELYTLIKEINKIGTNINQIARRTNLGFRKDEPLKKALSETQNKLDKTISLLNSVLQINNPNFE